MADPKTAALAAAWAVQQAGADAWANLCEQFVENAYGTTGQLPSAKAAIGALKPRRTLEGAKPGDLVLFAADPSNQFNGHAAIYLGNGRMISATPTGVKETGILDDPYYSRLFVGVAEAPAQWKGQASTDKLEQGAQRILQAAGATNVADSQKLTALRREERDLQARLDQNKKDAADYAKAQQLVPKYRNDKTPDAKWLPANGVTKQEMDHLEEVYDRVADPKDLRAEITKDETALRTLRVQIGDAQDDAAKPGTSTTNLQYNSDKSDPYILLRNPDGTLKLDASGQPQTVKNPNYQPPAAAGAKTFQGQDGLQYLLSDDGKTATLVAGQPQAPAKQTTYQIVTNPADKSTWTYDPAKGQLVTQLFEGPAPAEQQPENVSAPTNQPKIVRRAPDGALITEDNPNYQAPEAKPATFGNYGDPVATYTGAVAQAKGLAQAKRDELTRRVNSKELTLDQARAEFGTWWQTNVETPLAGYRSAAESATAQLQAQNETAQNAENVRAEGINRQRETTALSAGDALRDKAAALVPSVRSQAYLDAYGKAAQAMATGGAPVTIDPSTFRPDPDQIPDLNAMADQEVARVLAHISPAAAAKVGRPLPQLPQGPALEAFIPQYAPAG